MFGFTLNRNRAAMRWSTMLDDDLRVAGRIFKDGLRTLCSLLSCCSRMRASVEFILGVMLLPSHSNVVLKVKGDRRS
jgi:hypothetical protein